MNSWSPASGRACGGFKGSRWRKRGHTFAKPNLVLDSSYPSLLPVNHEVDHMLLPPLRSLITDPEAMPPTGISKMVGQIESALL